MRNWWKRMFLLLAVSIILGNTACRTAYPAEPGASGTGTCVDEDSLQEYPGSGERRYYYRQLSGEAALIYRLMEQIFMENMYSGSAETERQDRDSTVDAFVSAMEEDEGFALYAFRAARDAFVNDYPEAFYLDMSKTSLMVRGKSGRKRISLIVKDGGSCIADGFTKDSIPEAVSRYQERVKEIAVAAQCVAPCMAKDPEIGLIAAVHDILTGSMIYRRPEETSAGMADSAYDGLVYGEGVCEAYSRSFQAVMDYIGIPCVCIYGEFQSGGEEERHMWNEVMTGGKWYAVDVTHDDPSDEAWTCPRSGHENHDFLLAGGMDLSGSYLQDGDMSGRGCGMKFHYPAIEWEGLNLQDTAVTIPEENKKEQATKWTERLIQNAASGLLYMLKKIGIPEHV